MLGDRKAVCVGMSLVFAKNMKVTRAVVLAGGQGTLLTPLTKYLPTSLVPVLNRPLVEHTISHLKNNGITDIIIAGSKGAHSRRYQKFIAGNPQLSGVRYMEDEIPRGTAGVIQDLKKYVEDEPFVVVSGNCFLGDFELDAALKFHFNKNALLTIAVQRSWQFSQEGVRCLPDGLVEEVIRTHSSRARRSSIESIGVYIVNPAVFEYIEPRSYFDIKEQLVPALRKASLPVYAYEVERFCKALYTVKDYFDLQRILLMNTRMNAGNRVLPEGTTEIADGIWVGKNVTISSKAHLLGPVIIGSDTTIERNTQVIGPAAIGSRCVLEKGSFVRESVLWDETVMEAGSRAQYCIIQRGMRVTSGEFFSNAVIVDVADAVDASLMASDHVFHGITALRPSVLNGRKRSLFLLAKRSIDIMASAAGLVAILPVLLVIALAVKLDSHGPVLFRQRRSGRDGKDFGMLKFRTMVKDAEKQQQLLASNKDIDGPMFKLVKDPRVTRVGAFLRKTSLDELPQLINVLRGEMSLVGPRPLVMDEMKCSPSWRDIRLRVKPGITGLWQVSGRSEGYFHDWIRHDVHYVMNQSLLMDLKILLRTIKVVLKKVGAY